MAAVVPALPRFKFTLASGAPAALGWVTVYEAGTTTLTTSWQDKAQTTANTNPINLDANGECLLWLDSAKTYKLLLQDSALATVSGWPVDNIPGAADIGAATAAAQDWAIKTSAAVSGSDYSAKEYAQGTQASTGGSAKNWAQQTGADVTGASANSRSAKAWAQENLAGATLGGSAKDWAQSASLPDGTSKSAKSYAADGATALTATETARDAALAATKIYASTAAGLAAVASGEYFYVPSTNANESLILYLDNAGSAVEQKRYTTYVGVHATAAERVSRSTTKSRNLFDVSAVTASFGVLAATGALTASANYQATDYLAVTPGESLVSSQASYGTGGTGLAWYDQNKVFISGTSVILAVGVAVTVPAGAYFVRITYFTSTTTLSTLMIVNSATLPTAYQAFNEPALFPTLVVSSKVSDASRPLSRTNLYDPDAITPLMRFNTSTGAEIADASGNFIISNYIPVVPGVGVKTYPALASTISRVAVYYDKNRSIILPVVSGGPWADGLEFIPPNEAMYVRFCLAAYLDEDEDFVCLRSTATKEHRYRHTPVTLSDSRQWYGKEFRQLGDSISFGNTLWHYLVADYLGATQLQHTASGRRMYQALLTSAGVALVDADFDGVHQVNIFLGVNDCAQNTPLGTISSAPAALLSGSSFYGVTKTVIETLMGWNSDMLVTVSIPIYNSTYDVTPNSLGLYLEDYREALREVAALYGCPVLDFPKLNNINAITAAHWLSDGTHPFTTAAGQACLLNPAKGFFNGLWPLV